MSDMSFEERVNVAAMRVPFGLRDINGTIFRDIMGQILTSARTLDQFKKKSPAKVKFSDLERVEIEVSYFELYCKLITKNRDLQINEFVNVKNRDLSKQFPEYVRSLQKQHSWSGKLFSKIRRSFS